MSEDEPAGDVGYRRPPVQHRFAPGRSGNPCGRPRRPRDLATLLAAALDAKILVNQNGTRRRITTRDAVVSKLLLGGLKGSHRDTRDTLRLIAALLLPDAQPATGDSITIVPAISEMQCRTLDTIARERNPSNAARLWRSRNPRGMPMITKSWLFAALPLVLAAALLVTSPILWPAGRGIVFFILIAIMWAEFNVLGWLLNRRAVGAFIDNRNRISLSKLQAAAWTTVVLSGFATAAAYNIATATYQGTPITALAIIIPGDLLLAMGISTTSLVATPALLALKSHQPEADDANLMKARARLGADVTANGKVLIRPSTESAAWADLVTGEELGNAGSPDLGKIQQAAITLLLLGCYIAYTYADLAGSQETVRTLPTLDQSFVWLLGISHASYLAYKAVPHTT